MVVVTDSAGQKRAYVYYEDEPGRRSARLLASPMRERPEGRQGPTKGLWITFLSRAFIFATSSMLLKSGPLSPLESAAPIFCPIPRHPQEVGADIIQIELWPYPK